MDCLVSTNIFMMICLISGKETAVEMKTTANEEVIFTNRYMNLLSQMY